MTTTLLTARLRMVSAGGVAAPERVRREDDRHTLPLRVDPAGRFHLPGTTVAGSLRAHCASLTGLPDDLFGSAPGANRGTPSRVRVLGTRLVSSQAAAGATSTTRTAIDRHRGAPRDNVLFAQQRLPAGTEFDVMLCWDDLDPGQDAALRTAIKRWQPRIGRGASIGAGRSQVVAVGSADFDLATVNGLRRWLALRTVEDYPIPADVPDDAPQPEPALSVLVEIVDGLIIRTGVAEVVGSEGPQVTKVAREAGQVVVPGSSLKGFLRSRTEYICRVCGMPACPDATCGSCRPCRIFGHSPGAGQEYGGARARVAVSTAVIDDAAVEQRQHVAIDRFSGGSRQGWLYTEEVVVAGRFRIDVEALDPLDAADRMLLHAVVADLDDGLVGIGSSTTRGFGTVRVIDEHWRRPHLATVADTLQATS